MIKKLCAVLVIVSRIFETLKWILIYLVTLSTQL